jgi:predicted nucleic acid-binding protein
MILVDTCVWIGHLRRRDATLEALLEQRLVVSHEYVVGELLSGRNDQHGGLIDALEELPWLPKLEHAEFRSFASRPALAAGGLGFVDTHLLGSVRITAGATLMTYDQRLKSAFERLAVH